MSSEGDWGYLLAIDFLAAAIDYAGPHINFIGDILLATLVYDDLYVSDATKYYSRFKDRCGVSLSGEKARGLACEEAEIWVFITGIMPVYLLEGHFNFKVRDNDLARTIIKVLEDALKVIVVMIENAVFLEATTNLPRDYLSRQLKFQGYIFE